MFLEETQCVPDPNGGRQLAALLAVTNIDVFTTVKLYAVEVAGTVVFVVFIVVEAIKAIKHLVASIQKD